MKKYLLFLLAAILPALRIGAQQPPGVACQEWQVVAGDTIPHVRIRPVWVFARGADLRRYRKLVAAVKKVYPVAKIARARMTEMEAELQRLPTKKAQKAYIRGVYRQIKEEYTPVVKHMTRTQGKVRDGLHRLRSTAGIPRRIRGRILADLVARLRAGPQIGVRRRRGRPPARTDRPLLRSGIALTCRPFRSTGVGTNRIPKNTDFSATDRNILEFFRKFVNEPAGIRLPFDEQPSTAPPCRPCRTTGLCARPLLYIIH